MIADCFHRFGYGLFYSLPYFLQNYLEILRKGLNVVINCLKISFGHIYIEVGWSMPTRLPSESLIIINFPIPGISIGLPVSFPPAFLTIFICFSRLSTEITKWGVFP